MASDTNLKVRWGTQEIGFSVRRGDIKRLRIAVRPDGTLLVSAPLHASNAEIAGRVQRRGSWIVRQLERFAEWRPRTPPRQYVSGETHLFQGRQLRLRVITDKRMQVKVAGDRLEVHIPPASGYAQIRDLLQRWYVSQARDLLRRRYREQSVILTRHGIEPPRLIVRAMTARWGSLTPAGNLVLNSDLVRASPRLVDYVIAHETAHILYPDHGQLWQRLIARMMPDWRARKNELERQLL